MAFAPVQICPTAPGRASRDRRTTRASTDVRSPGNLHLTAFPPSESSRTPGHAGPVTIEPLTFRGTSRSVRARQRRLTDDITSFGRTDDGSRSRTGTIPFNVRTQACAGGTATYELSVDGHVDEGRVDDEGPAWTYAAVVARSSRSPATVRSDHRRLPRVARRAGRLRSVHQPERPGPGQPRTPVSGATVVLMRAGAPTDASVPVPDGSAVMSTFQPDEPRRDKRRRTVAAGMSSLATTWSARASRVRVQRRSLTSLRRQLDDDDPPPVTNLTCACTAVSTSPHRRHRPHRRGTGGTAGPGAGARPAADDVLTRHDRPGTERAGAVCRAGPRSS